MRFNIEDYKGKYVMHCKTEEEAEDFCRYLDNIGRKWHGGDSYVEFTEWNEYEEKTCYDFNDGYYAPISYYIINNYKILEWGDFYGQQIYKSRFKKW